MVLQYVAASFHLPSVSTANINTVQYTKPYRQYEVPTIPDVVLSKVLLPQSNIMAAFFHSHCSLFCDVSPCLPTYNIHNVTNVHYAPYGHLLVTCSYFCFDCKRNEFVAKMTTDTHTWGFSYLLSALTLP